MNPHTTSFGAFSLSLSVKNLEAAARFYALLGFEKFAGDGKTMLILKNGHATVGLFQGMFEKNMLTFNPGWDASCAPLSEFTDVRELQQRLEAAGVPFVTKAAAGKGPASFVVVDPDGNPVLVDQHR